jgi:histidyl-tRNA synthetase
MKYKSIKGTKDVLPHEVHRWQSVEEKIRAVMEIFNYREIRTPVFEDTELFARGIGKRTDIVGKEMYTFEDKGGQSLTLKPEMTASVMRSYIQHNLGDKLQLTKVYYLSPMFRQERPQAGRLRQFHQFGAEAIGTRNARVDVEIIALAVSIYGGFGITNFTTKINSVGCPECRPRYRELLTTELKRVYDKLSPESQRRVETNPLRVLDSKEEADRLATDNSPLMKDYLCKECFEHFELVQNSLAALNITFEVDGRIVRGLDYYTKTAFEMVSAELGSQDALAGGGRYDLLIEELGGKPTPGVGFAAGMERLMLVLEKSGYFFDNEPRPTVFIAALDDASRAWAMAQAHHLRINGISCDIDYLGRSLKAQMREADRQKVGFVMVIGEKELGERKATIRHMATGNQRTIPFDEILDVLNKHVQ